MHVWVKWEANVYIQVIKPEPVYSENVFTSQAFRPMRYCRQAQFAGQLAMTRNNTDEALNSKQMHYRWMPVWVKWEANVYIQVIKPVPVYMYSENVFQFWNPLSIECGLNLEWSPTHAPSYLTVALTI